MAVENPKAIDMTVRDDAALVHWLHIVAWRDWRKPDHEKELLRKLSAYDAAIIDGVLDDVFPTLRHYRPAILIACEHAPPPKIVGSVATWCARHGGHEVVLEHGKNVIWSSRGATPAAPPSRTKSKSKPSSKPRSAPKSKPKVGLRTGRVR